MKVKCIEKYYDKEKEEYIEKNAMFDVEKKRAEELIARRVVQEIKKEPKESSKESQGNTGASKKRLFSCPITLKA